MTEIVIMTINLIFTVFHVDKKLEASDETTVSRVLAFVVIPGLLILFLVAAASRGWLGIDLDRPVSIAQIKTQVISTEERVPKQAAVLVAEPVAADYNIAIVGEGAQVWTSLDEPSMKSNKNSLINDKTELQVQSEFYGVEGEPVAIVVDGGLGSEINFRGKKVRTNDFPFTSRRSVSVVFWPMTVCFLMYGISVATGAPIVRRQQRNTRKKRAKPNKN
jgi:hypothetical protein